MSAFIVSKQHIDNIVSTATGWRYCMPRGMTQDELGRMLWTENYHSVTYRYGESDHLPGPVDFELHDVDDYQWAPFSRVLTPVKALKAIACLEYQSCEHPEWEQSAAKRFCDQFRLEAISELPGYDEAPWEWRK